MAPNQTTQNKKLKINFGQPEHGWLPVDIRQGEFELQFTASDVPINPLDQLISVVMQITKGIAGEVWWHTEPEGYYFDFNKEGNLYKLSISFSRGETAKKEPIFKTEGNYESIVMPFYRSIKNFFSRSVEEHHWPKTNENEIEKLTKTIVTGLQNL